MKKILMPFILVTALSNYLNAQGEPQPDSCLIAKYYFNSGTTNDDHTGGYHGKQVGATLVPDRFGNSNSAWYLNGTPNSYINLGTHSALKPTTLSVSMWFKITAPEYSGSGYTYNPLLLTKCQGGTSYHEAYCIYYNYNTGQLGTGCTQLPTTNQPSVWNAGPGIGSWHHAVMTFDNDSIKLYLDAVFQGFALKGFSQVFLASDSIMVGNAMDGWNNRYFNGTIDDMRFYNCVISQTKVTSLYNEPNPLAAGIKNNTSETKMSIFPSPTNGEFTLSLNKLNENATVEIYNAIGQIIRSETLRGLKTKIDLNENANGVYFVKVISDNGSTVKKLIKE